MIRIKIAVKSLNGETYTNNEEVGDSFIVSKQNEQFLKLIEDNVKRSSFEEIDSVKVTAYFGEI